MDAGRVAADESAQQVPPSVMNACNMAGGGNVFATATAPGATAIANVSKFNLQHAETFAAAIRAAESALRPRPSASVASTKSRPQSAGRSCAAQGDLQ